MYIEKYQTMSKKLHRFSLVNQVMFLLSFDVINFFKVNNVKLEQMIVKN